MTKAIYWIVAVVLCVGLFAGAIYLYNHLKDDYQPTNDLVVVNPTTAPTTQPTSEAIDTEPNEETTTAPAAQTTADFTVYDADGNPVKLSGYFGKPIVLNFWASWCPPCKSEMPHFEAAYLANPDVQFLMVNMTSGDDMDSAKAFIEENGYTFPVLFDTTGEAGYVYQATSLPMTLFIDENGVLITYGIGALSAETLDKGISMINPDAE